jgi:hypothetical protein
MGVETVTDKAKSEILNGVQRGVKRGVSSFFENRLNIRDRDVEGSGGLFQPIKRGVAGAINAEPGQDYIAEATGEELNRLVRDVRVQFIEEVNCAQEQPPSYKIIRDKLVQPEDGLVSRIFKSLFARVLNLGAKISAYVPTVYTERLFGEGDEEETKRFRYYWEGFFARLFTGDFSFDVPRDRAPSAA